MRETWYVLEDGSFADPFDVVPDAAGLLRHKDGVAVAYSEYGPRSRGMSAEDIAAARAKPALAVKKAGSPKAADREMKAKPGAGYETR